VNLYTVIKDGIGYDKSQPAAHRQNVSPRFHPLLDEWFQVTHGKVKRPDGSAVVTRGRVLKQRIDHAVAATMPLLNILTKEGNPEEVAQWLEEFYSRVDDFRTRATSETVSDHIDDKADSALAAHQTAVDRLEPDMQAKVAATRLVTVARQTTSVVQRLATTDRDIARTAVREFRGQLANVALPDHLKTRLAGAETVADVVQHIAAIANGVEAIMTLADPEQRKQLFEKEFGRNWFGGVSELAKQALWIVQGSIAAYRRSARRSTHQGAQIRGDQHVVRIGIGAWRYRRGS
jgi:hypothetical protein